MILITIDVMKILLQMIIIQARRENFTHENCTLPMIHLGPASRRPSWALIMMMMMTIGWDGSPMNHVYYLKGKTIRFGPFPQEY